MSNDNSSGSGIGFFGLLTVAFIILKLIGVIKWSWFWVLSPVIFPTILVALLIVLAIIFK